MKLLLQKSQKCHQKNNSEINEEEILRARYISPKQVPNDLRLI